MTSQVPKSTVGAERATSIRAGQIRAIGRNDLDALLEIERLAYPIPWSYGLFYDCLLAKYECHGLWLDSELQGYFIAQQVADEWHLLNICVAPAHQRMGFGQVLLQAFIAKAKARAICRLLLEVRVSNLGAQALYLKSGFSEIGRRKNYYPSLTGREDGIVMDCFLAVQSQPVLTQSA